MPAQSILQIVSGFKPNVDGMGDFARRLGDALHTQSGIRSHFLVYRSPKTALDPAEILPNTLSYPTEASPGAAARAVTALRRHRDFDCALLHYGPYGYSSVGAPAEFVGLIEELSQTLPVLVFFHETYASGMPWKRAFWTNRQQRSSIVRLLEVAQVSFTSNAKYMQRLEKMSRIGRPLVKIPFSRTSASLPICALSLTGQSSSSSSDNWSPVSGFTASSARRLKRSAENWVSKVSST